MRFQVLLKAKRFGAAFALVDFFWGVDFEVRKEVLLQPALESAKRTLVSRFIEMLGSVRNQF